MVLDILFLTFSNADVLFVEQELNWRLYSLAEALSTTKRVQIIGKKKFTVVAFDSGKKTFVVHMAHLGAIMSIYPA